MTTSENKYSCYKKDHIKLVVIKINNTSVNIFSSVQLLSSVRLFGTPWTAACQASLSITKSQSLPKLMSIDLVISSNHLILCRPLLLLPSIFPRIRVFQMSQLFASGGQSIGVSALASVLPMKSYLILSAIVPCLLLGNYLSFCFNYLLFGC